MVCKGGLVVAENLALTEQIVCGTESLGDRSLMLGIQQSQYFADLRFGLHEMARVPSQQKV